MYLKNKNITLGVSGGIAAYKSVEIIRLLQKEGGVVNVVMTNNSTKFISPLTFEAISQNEVYSDLFSFHNKIKHIELAQKTNLLIIAPATANIIAKIANGIADCPLSTFVLAVKSKVIVCPSMNDAMYENPITQANIQKLKNFGFIIIEPEEGELACKSFGKGRLADPSYIVDRAISQTFKKDFLGKKVLITAGATKEKIDPVRFISNYSSGKMGYALAKIAEYRGASVVLISGKTNILKPNNLEFIEVSSCDEMHNAVFKKLKEVDIIIKVAAVADYKPLETAQEKIKKTERNLNLKLIKNIDILKAIGEKKSKKQILVGFAAETNNLKENAKAKLLAKNLDMIVANKVGENLSFGKDEMQASIIFKDGQIEDLNLQSKENLSNEILNKIRDLCLTS